MSGNADRFSMMPVILVLIACVGPWCGRVEGQVPAAAAVTPSPISSEVSISPAAMGYKAAIRVDLGAPLKMGPVAKALAKRFGPVAPAGGGVFVPNVRTRDEAAWVLPDGEVVIAGKRELADPKTFFELKLAFDAVANEIAGVVLGVKASAVPGRFREHSEFFTLKADQYQYLYAKLPATFSGWVLNWPDARQTWARLVESPAANGWAKLILDEKVILSGSTSEPTSAELTRVAFGEHALGTDDWQHGGWLAILAFFPTPGGNILLYDKANKSVVTKAAFSRTLKDLALPAGRKAPVTPAGELTPATLGFKAAVCVDLGTSIRGGPIRRALTKTFGAVHDTADGLYIPKAGARGEAAWVFPDGRIIVAGRMPLTGQKVFSQLELACKAVAGEVAGVVAEVTEAMAEEKYLSASEFYTPLGGQFQFLYASAPRTFYGWTLNWPNARKAWARLVKSPVANGWATLLMDEKQILKGSTSEASAADLTKVTFGEHALSTTSWQHGGYLVIGAYFPVPNGSILLYDKAGTSKAAKTAISWPLGDLALPACKAYPSTTRAPTAK